MTHHHRSRGVPDWVHFTGQLLAWAVVVLVVLLFVTGCKSDDPAPGPTPEFVRESAPSCGRCFERPELGHGE